MYFIIEDTISHLIVLWCDVRSATQILTDGPVASFYILSISLYVFDMWNINLDNFQDFHAPAKGSRQKTYFSQADPKHRLTPRTIYTEV